MSAHSDLLDALDRVERLQKGRRPRNAWMALAEVDAALDRLRVEVVVDMRRGGDSWRVIGQVLNVDHASAHRRYSAAVLAARAPAPRPPAPADLVLAQRDPYAGLHPSVARNRALRDRAVEVGACWCGDDAPDGLHPTALDWRREHREHVPAALLIGALVVR